jgi:hypothetical protein
MSTINTINNGNPLSKPAMGIFNGSQFRNEEKKWFSSPSPTWKIDPADALTKPLGQILHE